MNRDIRLLPVIIVFAIATVKAQRQAQPQTSRVALAASYTKLPLTFELNQGQTDGEVKFLSRGMGYSLYLTGNQAVLALQGNQKSVHDTNLTRTPQGATSRDMLGQRKPANPRLLQMTVVGANAAAKLVGLEQLPGKSNYFIGNDPKKWHTNVPTYAKVKYQGVYRGVDLVYYGNQDGQLEYDFIVAAGTDSNVIAISLEDTRNADSPQRGASVSVDSNGDILFHCSGGDVRLQKPVVYQERADGQKEYRDGRYLLASGPRESLPTRISFVIGNYDHSRPLVIDPAITYSTFLGGTGNSTAGTGIAVFTDPSTGHTYAYITGSTCDLDFPTVNAKQSGLGGTCDLYGHGNADAFITKFDPSASGQASVIYNTYLGGSGVDAGTGIAIDSTGNAYIAGTTQSTDFPTMNAYQSTLVPGQNAFMTKLSADGSTLLYSTYFGGGGQYGTGDSANAIAVGAAGHAYIAGATHSSALPLMNPFQSAPPQSSGAAFVASFDTSKSGSLSLVYSTYLGGSNLIPYAHTVDTAYGIAVDAAGTIHVAGEAMTTNFPVVNGYQIGGGGAFYARLDPSKSASAQLLYSTCLGEAGSDGASAIALDAAGNSYLAGNTGSGAFPTTSILGQRSSSNPQADPNYTFVAKINPSLTGSSSLVYSTVFYTGNDPNTGIAVDASGNAFVGGTAFPGLQLVNPALQSPSGVVQSTNGGQNWTPLTNGLTDFPITALVVDTSTSPRTIYAGTWLGTILVTTDGGLNWNKVLQVPSTNSGTCYELSNDNIGTHDSNVCVMALAVDPTAPSNVYAGTSAGVYKSADRGSTWSLLNNGLSSTAIQGIQALQFDDCLPQCPAATTATLYAGADDGIYRLDPGSTSWAQLGLTFDVLTISLDPTTTPHSIFTAGCGGPDCNPGSAFRGTVGGSTWTQISGGGMFTVAVDTGTTPSTLYGITYEDDSNSIPGTLWRSVDGGNTWDQKLTGWGPLNNGPSPLGASAAHRVVVDRSTTPSTLYLLQPNTGDLGYSAGILKSTDGWNHWNYVLTAGSLNLDAIALDSSTTPNTAYAAARPAPNAFVAELNPSGTAFLFSTYLGAIPSTSWASGVVLDSSDNIYVTGTVLHPMDFPVVHAFQTPPTNNNNNAATLASFAQGSGVGVGGVSGQGAFFTVLGSQTLPTTSSGSVTSQVAVQNGSLAITLPNISGSTTGAAPTLTVDPVPSSTTANYGLSNNLGAYDISTTATFSGSVTLCFQATTVNDLTTFNNLQLFHIVNGSPVDVTSSRNFSTRTVCGNVSSLSPFVLFSPTTSAVIAASLNPSTYGQSVTFTATAAASGAIPTGTVAFYDGANSLGTQTLNSSGQATLDDAALPAGTHTITAVYGGSGPLHSSTSAGYLETISKGSTKAAITTSATPSILNQSITFTATVSAVAPASGAPTGTVAFYDGNTQIGTAKLNASAQGTVTISSMSVGSHSVTAVYAGDNNFSGSTSSPLTQAVIYQPLGTNCLGGPGHQILQPINADGSSVWKQGRTVPAQFRVCDANGVSVGTANVVSSFYLTKIISGTVANVDETVSSTSSDTAFHWDSTNQQWVFNISTKSLSANITYVYIITLNDGTTIGFQYGLK